MSVIAYLPVGEVIDTKHGETVLLPLIEPEQYAALYEKLEVEGKNLCEVKEALRKAAPVAGRGIVWIEDESPLRRIRERLAWEQDLKDFIAVTVNEGIRRGVIEVPG